MSPVLSIVRQFSLRLLLFLGIGLFLPLSGCGGGQAQSHFLPDQFTGPVVVVYGVPDGMTIDETSTPVELKIPSNGILRIANPGPPRSYSAEFFYAISAEEREKLRFGVSADSLQVFGLSIGKTMGDETGWIAYLVGVPSARSDWIALREAAIEDNVPPMKLRQAAEPES